MGASGKPDRSSRDAERSLKESHYQQSDGYYRRSGHWENNPSEQHYQDTRKKRTTHCLSLPNRPGSQTAIRGNPVVKPRPSTACSNSVPVKVVSNVMKKTHWTPISFTDVGILWLFRNSKKRFRLAAYQSMVFWLRHSAVRQYM